MQIWIRFGAASERGKLVSRYPSKVLPEVLRPIYNLQSESRDESNNKGKDGAVTAEEADGAAIEATTLEEDGAKEESVKCEPAVVYDYNQQQTTHVSEPPQKNSDH